MQKNKKQIVEKIKKEKIIRRIKRYKKAVYAKNYNRRAHSKFELVDNNSSVTLAIDKALNSLTDVFIGGQKNIESLIRVLSYDIEINSLCVHKSYNDSDIPFLVDEIHKKINTKTKVIIDVQGVYTNSESIVFIETNTKESKIQNCMNKIIRYSFEYKCRDFGIKKTVGEFQPNSNSIIKKVIQDLNIYYVPLGINMKYFTLIEKDLFIKLYISLLDTLKLFLNLDWDSNNFMVYKLGKADVHKPQDKIELETTEMSYNDLYNIISYRNESEKVRLHKIGKGIYERYKTSKTRIEEYVFLTNRLITLITGKEWNETLNGMPIIIFGNLHNNYKIGMPLVDKIDSIFFSSKLYESKKNEAQYYDYMLINKFTDSRYYLDFKNLDYGDKGRVKEEKIMIPRYHKKLLGYLDFPYKMIRSEEFVNIEKKLRKNELQSFQNCYESISGEVYYQLRERYVSKKEKKIEEFDFVNELLFPNRQENGILKSIIYKKLAKNFENDNEFLLLSKSSIEDYFEILRIEEDNTFYILTLKDKEINDNNESVLLFLKRISLIKFSVDEIIDEYLNMSQSTNSEEIHIKKNIIYTSFAQGRLGLFDTIELIRIPKNIKKRKNIFKWICNLVIEDILNLFIGKVEYLLKVEWCSETDDKNNIARLSSKTIKLLGISENDKIIITYGSKKEILRVLINDEIMDYQIGIPAPTRKKLGMNSINDIVTVSRDMRHIFLRHSESQAMAILGSVLTVFQIFPNKWIGLGVSLFIVPIIMYFVLNVERIKVK